jgi:hypothetical protein
MSNLFFRKAENANRAGLRWRHKAAMAGALLALPAVLGAWAVAPSAAGASPVRSAGTGPVRTPVVGQPNASAPVPHVTGPIPGPIPTSTNGGPAIVTPQVLQASGYQQQEFFLSGRAKAYKFVRTPASNGRWKVIPAVGSSAPYKTRIEVLTPVHRKAFSGKVVVEWDNVSGGADALPDLTLDHADLFRQGDVYVGVSAQFVGVKGAALNNPARYGSLVQPGDSYSYDIFSQAGMAVRDRYAPVLGGLRPSVIVADGISQSAIFLQTYTDAFAPVYNVYDGYVVHSRSASVSPLQEAPGMASVLVNGMPTNEPNGNVGLTSIPTPSVVLSRTDIAAPVLSYMTQTDVYSPPAGLLNYGPATQANSRGFRLWEAAGTSHADACQFFQCIGATGNQADANALFNQMLDPPSMLPNIGTCSAPINTGEALYTFSMAVRQLLRWAATGGALRGIPALAPPLLPGSSSGSRPPRPRWSTATETSSAG